ncbi:MAG: VOC family protein [Bacteroidota bacterium]
MANLNPYLSFDGRCEEAFNFYKEVFGGEFAHVGRFSEMPPQFPVSESDANRIMHITLPIGGGTVLMGSDIFSESRKGFTIGNNFSVSIHVDSQKEADKLFAGLAKGGNISMPLQQTFWGSYFGSLTDSFGVNWMISFGA